MMHGYARFGCVHLQEADRKMASRQFFSRLAAVASQTVKPSCASAVFRASVTSPSLHGRVVQSSVNQLARLHTSAGHRAERDDSVESNIIDQGREEGFIPNIKHATRETVEEKILEIVKEFDKVEAVKVNLDCHFIKDLGLDSLDAIELVMAFEDEFDVDIPDEDAEQMLTPQSAVEFICKAKQL